MGMVELEASAGKRLVHAQRDAERLKIIPEAKFKEEWIEAAGKLAVLEILIERARDREDLCPISTR
jgi:hypothetical protein